MRRRDAMPTQSLGDIFAISVLRFSHENHSRRAVGPCL